MLPAHLQGVIRGSSNLSSSRQYLQVFDLSSDVFCRVFDIIFFDDSSFNLADFFFGLTISKSDIEKTSFPSFKTSPFEREIL